MSTSSITMAEAEAKRGPVFVICICALYICCSAMTISFNKYLMNEKHFPYALALAMFQMACQTFFSCTLYKAYPHYFPSIHGVEGANKISMDRRLLTTALMPISALFALQLLFANGVYQHLSIAFIQMMKMANVVVVYLLSVLVALDKLAVDRAFILLLIVLATSMTVEGERHFSLRGFVLQATSQLFGCVSLVLQGTVLTQGRGKKLDVMSYQMLISPITLCMLILFAGASYANVTVLLKLPTFQELVTWSPLLFLNSCLVYGLNIGITSLVKHTSPVGLCLAGMLKDAAVVVSGVGLHGEIITKMQTAGFGAQLGLIYMYAQLRRTEEPKHESPTDVEVQRSERDQGKAADATDMLRSVQATYGAAGGQDNK
mmetsp:Transcript_101254/g.194063  ORF Transcript_101254/g.194063 Transcript_101254/m.194063 type:complete len:374 (-) Transcript_101254:96-1217(-)